MRPLFALTSFCTFIAGLAVWAAPASAQMGSFSYPPQAAFVQGGAVIADVGIVLPNSGPTTFVINFVLPRDYKSGEPVKIHVYLKSDTTCQVRVAPTLFNRKRVGSVIAGGGFTGGNPLVSLTALVIGVKVFTLQPGDTIPGQKPGDAFSVGLARDAANASDTCAGPVTVHAIDIRYPLAP
jgi:hypothetical protein